jgi:hypothetical protein
MAFLFDSVLSAGEASRRGVQMLTDFAHSRDVRPLRRAVKLLRSAVAQTSDYESVHAQVRQVPGRGR